MNRNLETITQLAADAGAPQWLVSTGRGDFTSNGVEHFHLVEGALRERYGGNALNFGTDARTAWFASAVVNTAPAMAEALLSLTSMAEAVPEDAPAALRGMAKAILDAAASVPAVRPMPVEYNPSAEAGQ